MNSFTGHGPFSHIFESVIEDVLDDSSVKVPSYIMYYKKIQLVYIVINSARKTFRVDFQEASFGQP